MNWEHCKNHPVLLCSTYCMDLLPYSLFTSDVSYLCVVCLFSLQIFPDDASDKFFELATEMAGVRYGSGQQTAGLFTPPRPYSYKDQLLHSPDMQFFSLSSWQLYHEQNCIEKAIIVLEHAFSKHPTKATKQGGIHGWMAWLQAKNNAVLWARQLSSAQWVGCLNTPFYLSHMCCFLLVVASYWQGVLIDIILSKNTRAVGKIDPRWHQFFHYILDCNVCRHYLHLCAILILLQSL